MNQSRWKSWVLWSTIGTAIIVILRVFGVWDKVGITDGTASDLVAALLQVFVVFGIINNPQNADGV